MITTTLYNINSIRSIEHVQPETGLDQGEAYLKIKLEGTQDFLYIYGSDELYPYHMKNFENLKKQLTASWDKKEEEDANTPPME